VLLDFGLAKADTLSTLDNTGDCSTEVLTEQGQILGTFPYMAPEQLHGASIDARTDIFAFGAVLYEMITGRRAFAGDNQASLIASILEHEPPPARALQGTPGLALDRTIGKALAKQAADRWQTARDLKDELDWIQRENLAGTPDERMPRRRTAFVAVLACLALALSTLAALLLRDRAEQPQSLARFEIALPSDVEFVTTDTGGPTPQLAVSPNGRLIAFVAAEGGPPSALWLRALDSVVAQKLPGTEGAFFPFWAPDNRRIGFSQAAA
jgi:serine/threonine protein kinase